MSTAYINIGSNQGDRERLIKQAVALIEHWAGAKAEASRPVESEPWGFDSTSRFINVGLALEVNCTPEKLLDALLEIERSICPASHRDSHGNYIDRSIDIDLIAVDSEVRDSDRLTLPHPAMHLREFVLRPMVELAPSWIHPRLGKTPGCMLRELLERRD